MFGLGVPGGAYVKNRQRNIYDILKENFLLSPKIF